MGFSRAPARTFGPAWVIAGALACGPGEREEQALSVGASAESEGGGESDASAGSGAGKLDVGAGTGLDSGGAPSCTVEGGLDGVSSCDEVAPPDSFTPEVQWAFLPDDDEILSLVLPLVANLTDDDGDGDIDLCDIPDVVLVATKKVTHPAEPGHVYVIDGETGVPHLRIETGVKENATPAIADLDEDGVPEIVTATWDDGYSSGGQLIALRPDGTTAWISPHVFPAPFYGGAVAIADADNDGSPEILYHDMLFDEHGALLVQFEVGLLIADASAFADLDGDGDQEVVFGHVAFHHDGTPHYTTALGAGFPAVADLDDDPEPEVLLTNEQGISLLEHDGTVKYSGLRPTGVAAEGLNWVRPATVHNFDADPEPEYALSSRDFYSVYEADGSIVWSSPVLDESGFAAGTAFDFLGDAEAEAMYADESTLFIFDGTGGVLLSQPRFSHTLHEYPVVADLDNDGSAEIVVVSEEREALLPGGTSTVPTIQVIRDAEDRWIPSRRIWNQHSYHVTNVREDATIPQFEPPHWQLLNTWRTNAQLAAGGELCQPVPQG